MAEQKKAPGTQVSDDDPADIPATTGGQGGTSQPGPPVDPDEEVNDVDFSEPDTGEGGTDKP